jgi:hypothetical protein
MQFSSEVSRVCGAALRFVEACRAEDDTFKLTPRSEPTPFGRCFAIFVLHLLGEGGEIAARGAMLHRRIVGDVKSFAARRRHANVELQRDKAFLQLLTFSLSALAIMGEADDPELAALIPELLPAELEKFLRAAGTFEGVAQSGNLAMFHAILMLSSKDSRIAEWRDLHLQHANERGFWGRQPGMTYLQFQNGYHQYEILHFLHCAGELNRRAAPHVAALADVDGHFAPYPGGGGCFDYDAVALLTSLPPLDREVWRPLLLRTAQTIIAEQNADGGFCESQFVRPHSPGNLLRALKHAGSVGRPGAAERLRYTLTLQRPKHDRIKTHWSLYSRGWNESDLWDTWFRLMAIARIDTAFGLGGGRRWGFIEYPGIGYVPAQ